MHDKCTLLLFYFSSFLKDFKFFINECSRLSTTLQPSGKQNQSIKKLKQYKKYNTKNIKHKSALQTRLIFNHDKQYKQYTNK